jgi:hypothetical protein
MPSSGSTTMKPASCTSARTTSRSRWSKPDNPPRHLQRKRGSVSGSRQPEDQQYYHEVVEAFADAQEVLIVGPGHAKLELIKHIHAHDHQIVDRVVGVETVDHPGDGQLVAYARKYFVAKDRMLGQ